MSNPSAMVQKTGNILSFDASRVRPGLRDLVEKTRHRVEKSVQAAEWRPGSEITPEMVLDLLPDTTSMSGMDPLDLAVNAEHAAQLALLAIEDGAWSGPEALTTIFALKTAALRLKHSPKLRLKSA